MPSCAGIAAPAWRGRDDHRPEPVLPLLAKAAALLLEEGRGFQAPAALQLDQLAAAVPVGDDAGDQLAVGPVALVLRHGDGPGPGFFRRQRHLIAGPALAPRKPGR